MLIIVFIFHFLTFPNQGPTLFWRDLRHGMATANPYRPVLLAASLDPTGSVRWADAQLWGGEQWWNQGHKLLLGSMHTMFSTCKAVSWLEELDGGSELSRPLVQDRLSAAEHCSDTAGVQWRERGTRLTQGELALRWTWLNFCLTSETKHDLVEGKVLTRYKRGRRRSAMVSGKIPGPPGCSIPGGGPHGCSIPGPPGACVHLGNPNAQTLEQTLMCSSSK